MTDALDHDVTCPLILSDVSVSWMHFVSGQNLSGTELVTGQHDEIGL